MIDEKEMDDEQKNRPFDISPSHPIWTQMERGIQIILGLSLVTGFHFLGESWGEANVPYAKLFPPLGNVGMAFIASLLITPVAGYIGILLRALTPLPNYRVNQIRAIIFNIVLLALLLIFFSQAQIFIAALAEAAGLDPRLPETWENNLDLD